MLKIFTDATYLTEDNRKIVFPLLFDLWYVKNKRVESFYTLVNCMENADVVIVPVNIAYFYEYKKIANLFSFIDDAHQLSKKVWVYSAGDFGITLSKEVYTFRLGGFHKKLDQKTFIMPSFINDPYMIISDKFKPIIRTEVPILGFVGNANGSLVKYLKEFLIFIKLNTFRLLKLRYHDYQPFYPSSIKRNQFLKAFGRNKQIKSNFILRKKYRAGAKTKDDIKKTTFEFFKNIYENSYTFCLRGSGNFSVRLYETLAMGRIPVIIDTDIRLPLNDYIDWSKHCIISNSNDFETKLIEFNENIDESEFVKMQQNNRNLWLNYLTRENYFIQMHSIFKNEI